MCCSDGLVVVVVVMGDTHKERGEWKFTSENSYNEYFPCLMTGMLILRGKTNLLWVYSVSPMGDTGGIKLKMRDIRLMLMLQFTSVSLLRKIRLLLTFSSFCKWDSKSISHIILLAFLFLQSDFWSLWRRVAKGKLYMIQNLVKWDFHGNSERMKPKVTLKGWMMQSPKISGKGLPALG